MTLIMNGKPITPRNFTFGETLDGPGTVEMSILPGWEPAAHEVVEIAMRFELYPPGWRRRIMGWLGRPTYREAFRRRMTVVGVERGWDRNSVTLRDTAWMDLNNRVVFDAAGAPWIAADRPDLDNPS